MATNELQELIDKEVARQVDKELNARKDEVNESARVAVAKAKQIANDNEVTESKIAKQLSQLEHERQTALEESNENRAYLESYAAEVEKRAQAIQKSVRDSSEEKLITINMGGTIFHALKSTFSTMSPFFANLFSDKWRDEERRTIRDKDGNIFIDRDPTFFPLLLNWSREGADPNELVKMIEIISKKVPSPPFPQCWKLKCDTFMRTLDYLGIDHPPEPPGSQEVSLKIGDYIKIWWRGDGRIFKGIVIKIFLANKNGQEAPHFTSPSPVGTFSSAGICTTKWSCSETHAPIKMVQIMYDDGDIWEYRENKLKKKNGPFWKENGHYSNTLAAETISYANTSWWHYGTEWGSKKIKNNNVIEKKARANTPTGPPDSSSDESDL